MKVYKYTYNSDIYDVDMFGNPSFSRITEHMLIAGSQHSERIGWGRNHLVNDCGIALVLIKNHIKMINKLELGMEIEVSTWPLPRVYPIITRYFSAKDVKTGKIIWEGEVQCALMDLKTRMAINGNKFGLTNPEGDEEIPEVSSTCFRFDKKVRNELLETVPYKEAQYKVRYADLDYNGHVNSARYVDIVTSALGKDYFENKKPVALDIQYVNEVQPDNLINVKIYNRNDEILVYGFVNETVVFEGSLLD